MENSFLSALLASALQWKCDSYWVILLKFESTFLLSFAISQNQINLTSTLKTNADFQSHIYHFNPTSVNTVIHKRQFQKMSKIRTTVILQAQSSRSLRRFLGKTKQQASNNGAYLFRMRWVWWEISDATCQNYKSYWWFLGRNVTSKDLKGQVRRKRIWPKKNLKIETKDSPDSPW